MTPDQMQFQKLIENAPEAITLLGADGKLQYASVSAARMFGYDADEMAGTDPASLTHPEDLPDLISLLVDLMQQPGKVVTTQYRFRHKDGRWRWIESTISNLLAEPGVNAILFNFRDITERMEAEKALRESEERFRLAFRTSPDAINLNRLTDGLYIDVNEGFTQLTGYTREEVIGKTSREIDIWYDVADRERLVATMRSHGQINNLEARFRLKDGTVVRALMSAKVIFLDGVPHTLSITREIEQMKQMEDALSRSEERYRLLFEQASDGIFVTDAASNFIDVNPSGCAMFGYSREDILRMGMKDLLFPEKQEELGDIIERMHLDQEKMIEYRLRRKDGSAIYVEVNGKILADGRMQGMVRDISKRIEAETALRDSEELFRTAFRTSPDSIQLTRLSDGLIVDVNDGFTRITGHTREESIGRKSQELGLWHDMNDRQRLIRGLEAQGEVHNLEAKIRMKNGNIVRALLSAKIIILNQAPHLISISRNIEELKQMEDALNESNHRLAATLDELRQTQSQLVQQERLAAVGQLAAGIAHDFNNILAVITLQAQMVLAAPALSPAVRSRIEVVTQQARQAADLAQQMLDFGRRSVLQARPLNLVALLAEQVDLLQRTFPKQVQVKFSHDAEIYIVNADATRLQQMITNLALNARDAMPNGGTLTIHVSLVANEDILPTSPQHSAFWVRMTLRDTGAGIDASVLPKIFEPFFTTKEPGSGTGLGLAQVYGIVKQHNGCIDVQSQPGQGTTFVICLPLHSQPVTSASGAQLLSAPLPGKGETVLVVEDDPTLRSALIDMLDLLGYTALEAANGEDALALLLEDSARFSVILCDQIMPKMGGDGLWHELHRHQIDIPLLILSGYPPTNRAMLKEGSGVVGWLQKPIVPEKLAEAIAKAVQPQGILS